MDYGWNRAHFGAWCVVSAPLILGMDVTKQEIVGPVIYIITNPEAIAVNQVSRAMASPICLFEPSWLDCLAHKITRDRTPNRLGTGTLEHWSGLGKEAPWDFPLRESATQQTRH